MLSSENSTSYDQTNDELQVRSPFKVSAQAVDLLENVTDEAGVPSKYLGIFIDESAVSLDELANLLVSSEQGFEPEAFETLLITAHRIKGSAASIGLNRVAKFAHSIEDLLQLGREQKRQQFPTHVYDLLLFCLDCLNDYIAGLRNGNADSSQFGFIVWELQQIRQQLENGELDIQSSFATTDQTIDDLVIQIDAELTCECTTTAQGSNSQFTAAELETLKTIAPNAANYFTGIIKFQDNLPLAGMKARLLHEKLCRAAKVFYFEPTPDVCEQSEQLTFVKFACGTDDEMSKIQNVLQIVGVEQIKLEKLEVEQSAANSAAQSPSAASNNCDPATNGIPVGESKPVIKPTVNAATTTPVKKPTSSPLPTYGNNNETTNAAPSETLRVDIDRLDHLMNLAGQLVINKSRFARIGDTLKTTLPAGSTSMSDGVRSLHYMRATLSELQQAKEPPTEQEWHSMLERVQTMQHELAHLDAICKQFNDARSSINHLQEAVHQLDRISDGLQKGVMDTRMVPIGPLFTRFHRVIRDITRLNNKNVDLVIRGEKTELDKRMIDELGDPLIHMVRNSADHGIESPDERLAAGKPANGTITLDACHRGNNIVIRVSDDGCGLDPQKLKAKAIEKNIISWSDAERLTNQQIINLIWEPGFSTAEKVTEISGRGMGMDIVRSKIEEINGTVEVSGTPGAGTTITIKLPLTLAIMPCLLSKFEGDVFAMPLESIVEIVQVTPRELVTVYGQKTAVVRGRTISVVSLNDVFTWNIPGTKATAETADQTLTLVIVGDSGTELGVVVDHVLGESDIVIKSLAENYRNVPGISGASILGDGKVALILDSAAVIDFSSKNKS